MADKEEKPVENQAEAKADEKATEGENKAVETKDEGKTELKNASHSTASTEAQTALNILGVKIQKNSKCLPTDQRCIQRENEDAARAALELAERMKGIYVKKENKAVKDSSGLECTMDGYNKMIKELTEVLFMILAVVKEAALTMLPPEFSKGIKHLWDGMVGVQNWIGYFMAAFYFLGEEYDFGAGVCEFYGYGYYAIDWLHEAVDWAKSMGFDADKGLEGMIGGLVSQGMGALTGDTKQGVKDIASTDALKLAEQATKAALNDAEKAEKGEVNSEAAK